MTAHKGGLHCCKQIRAPGFTPTATLLTCWASSMCSCQSTVRAMSSLLGCKDTDSICKHRTPKVSCICQSLQHHHAHGFLYKSQDSMHTTFEIKYLKAHSCQCMSLGRLHEIVVSSSFTMPSKILASAQIGPCLVCAPGLS